MSTENEKSTSQEDPEVDRKTIANSNDGAPTTSTQVERRSADRARDDADWESKVVGRLNGRLKHLDASESNAASGWEADVLDALRKRIERSSQ